MEQKRSSHAKQPSAIVRPCVVGRFVCPSYGLWTFSEAVNYFFHTLKFCVNSLKLVLQATEQIMLVKQMKFIQQCRFLFRYCVAPPCRGSSDLADRRSFSGAVFVQVRFPNLKLSSFKQKWCNALFFCLEQVNWFHLHLLLLS